VRGVPRPAERNEVRSLFSFLAGRFAEAPALLVRGLLSMTQRFEFSQAEDEMEHGAAGLEELVSRFREILPAECDTAQAIDRREPFEQIALKAIEDGYIDFSHDFTQFIEACLRENA